MNKKSIKKFLSEMSFITDREGEIMYDLLQDQPINSRLLELGTGEGHSTLFFSLFFPNYLIYTVDGYGLYGGTKNLYNEKGILAFDSEGIDKTFNTLSKTNNNVIQIIGDTGSIPWDIPFNVIFIDSDHSYKGVKRDFEHVSPFLKDTGIILLHDYGTGWPGVKEYLDNEVASNPMWEVTNIETIAIVRSPR